jgi:metal-dependent HD superfamily phosphatase/phosphodiesterase
MVQVVLVPGRPATVDSAQLEQAIGNAFASGRVRTVFATGGSAVTIQDLAAGVYSACAVAGGILVDGASRPVRCKIVRLPETGRVQLDMSLE